MTRSAVLIPVVVVVALVLRALPQPVFLGATDPATETALGVAAPFGDDLKGSSDAFLSLQAKSLLREGLGATLGIPLLNVTKAEPADFVWYGHHPPGVAQVTALAFAIFGESELVARCVALFFSTVMLAALLVAMRRVAGTGAALAAAVGVCAAPLGWYWASHLDYQVPTLAAVTVFLTAALREPPSRKHALIATVALLLALWFDFLAVLAIAGLGAARMLTWPWRWKAPMAFAALALVTVLGLLTWMTFATTRHGRVLGSDLANWVSTVWTLPGGADSPAYFARIGRHLLERAGIGPLLGLVVGLGFAIAGLGPVVLRRLLLAGMVFALLAGALPRTRAWDHPYFQIPWLLPIGVGWALAAAVIANRRAAAAAMPAEGSASAAGAAQGRGAAIEPARRFGAGKLVAAGVVLLVVAEGACRSLLVRPEEDPGSPWRIAFARPERPADRPSAALLGRELEQRSRAAGETVEWIAVPAGSAFAEFVSDYYAGRIVHPVPAGIEAKATLELRERLTPELTYFGLATRGLAVAGDEKWPGREWFVLVPKPK